jgi:hypothetical protein
MVESPEAYRRLVENRITKGLDERFLSGLKDRVALGGDAFVERIRRMCGEDPEYDGLRMLRHRYDWNTVVGSVEKVKGCAWAEFAFIRGDWGRAAVCYLARKYGGLTLSEIGKASGGMKYPAVSKMIKRFEERMRLDAELKGTLVKIEKILMSKVQI